MISTCVKRNVIKSKILDQDRNGFIYILSHTSGTTVKVGETKVSPEAREKDYIKAYDLKGFKLTNTFKVPLEERKNIEKASHSILQKHHLSGLGGAQEIFSCTTEVAINAINTAISRNETARIQQRKEKIARAKRIEEDDKKQAIEQAWRASNDYKISQNKIDYTLLEYPLEIEQDQTYELVGKYLALIFFGGLAAIMGLNFYFDGGLGTFIGTLITGGIFLSLFSSSEYNSKPLLISSESNKQRYEGLLLEQTRVKKNFVQKLELRNAKFQIPIKADLEQQKTFKTEPKPDQPQNDAGFWEIFHHNNNSQFSSIPRFS